jgi:hypothetical protein
VVTSSPNFVTRFEVSVIPLKGFEILSIPITGMPVGAFDALSGDALRQLLRKHLDVSRETLQM